MTDRDLMQQALEALCCVRDMVAHPDNLDFIDKHTAALRERLAQPEQKPFCYHDGRNIVGKEYAHHCDVFPLYTHPAAQQPLTDEQFNRIPELYVIPPHHVEMVVRAIEAKLKEKNQ